MICAAGGGGVGVGRGCGRGVAVWELTVGPVFPSRLVRFHLLRVSVTMPTSGQMWCISCNITINDGSFVS